MRGVYIWGRDAFKIEGGRDFKRATAAELLISPGCVFNISINMKGDLMPRFFSDEKMEGF